MHWKQRAVWLSVTTSGLVNWWHVFLSVVFLSLAMQSEDKGGCLWKNDAVVKDQDVAFKPGNDFSRVNLNTPRIFPL